MLASKLKLALSRRNYSVILWVFLPPLLAGVIAVALSNRSTEFRSEVDLITNSISFDLASSDALVFSNVAYGRLRAIRDVLFQRGGFSLATKTSIRPISNVVRCLPSTNGQIAPAEGSSHSFKKESFTAISTAAGAQSNMEIEIRFKETEPRRISYSIADLSDKSGNKLTDLVLGISGQSVNAQLTFHDLVQVGFSALSDNPPLLTGSSSSFCTTDIQTEILASTDQNSELHILFSKKRSYPSLISRNSVFEIVRAIDFREGQDALNSKIINGQICVSGECNEDNRIDIRESQIVRFVDMSGGKISRLQIVEHEGSSAVNARFQVRSKGVVVGEKMFSVTALDWMLSELGNSAFVMMFLAVLGYTWSIYKAIRYLRHD